MELLCVKDVYIREFEGDIVGKKVFSKGKEYIGRYHYQTLEDPYHLVRVLVVKNDLNEQNIIRRCDNKTFDTFFEMYFKEIKD
ncbi:hypothetical protein CN931_23930 [Bacillus sp. AFS054943]|uniref:Uncharacterized protein n=1 Tax=Bacillus cereus TaxID=1396 RepID=A0A2C1LPK8_BACCE|nr:MULTISPECIES: hypothetical protein [Bacillus]PGL78065.1 hypothetical protein CN931_23930 [Bacillus sp. AFS054943]PGT99851.1 hypothetical protein COD19_18130 [Bacillus cereus]